MRSRNGPMTEDYAELSREKSVLVAERDGEIIGLVVLVTGRIDLAEYARRHAGDAEIVFLREQLR